MDKYHTAQNNPPAGGNVRRSVVGFVIFVICRKAMLGYQVRHSWGNELFLTCIHVPAGDVGYAAGENRIVKTTNGLNWFNVPQPNYGSFYTTYFPSSTEGYVAGSDIFDNGILLGTNDGGLNWNVEISGPTTPPFNFIYFPSINCGYACCSDGAIYRREINEIKWRCCRSAYFNIPV